MNICLDARLGFRSATILNGDDLSFGDKFLEVSLKLLERGGVELSWFECRVEGVQYLHLLVLLGLFEVFDATQNRLRFLDQHHIVLLTQQV